MKKSTKIIAITTLFIGLSTTVFAFPNHGIELNLSAVDAFVDEFRFK